MVNWKSGNKQEKYAIDVGSMHEINKKKYRKQYNIREKSLNGFIYLLSVMINFHKLPIASFQNEMNEKFSHLIDVHHKLKKERKVRKKKIYIVFIVVLYIIIIWKPRRQVTV
jgi:hypothetical protein